MAFCSVPWFEMGHCSLGWPQTCYVAEDDLELTLYLCILRWDYKIGSIHVQSREWGQGAHL